MGAVARRFHLNHVAKNAPKLSLPGKLVFPSNHNVGHFSMLGLGDIVMPGLLLCFVMRYDAYKKAQVSLTMDISQLQCILQKNNKWYYFFLFAQARKMAEAGVPLPNSWHRISYFHCSLFGYFLGLLTATVSSEVSIFTKKTSIEIILFFLLVYRFSKLPNRHYCIWYLSHCYLYV